MPRSNDIVAGHEHLRRGCYRFCYWQQMGKQFSKLLVSSDFGQGDALSNNLKVLHQLEPLSHRISVILAGIDPSMWAQRRELWTSITKNSPEAKLVTTSSLEVFSGRQLLYNGPPVEPHFDQNDDGGWSAMVVFGIFNGGDVLFPQLSARVSFVPGDVILLKASKILHCVTDWSGQSRFSIVHFMHKKTWEHAALLEKHLVDEKEKRRKTKIVTDEVDALYEEHYKKLAEELKCDLSNTAKL